MWRKRKPTLETRLNILDRINTERHHYILDRLSALERTYDGWVATLRDELIATQGALGVYPQGEYPTVADRLKGVELKLSETVRRRRWRRIPFAFRWPVYLK